MKKLVIGGLVAVLFSCMVVGQDAGNGLQVKPEPQCVVANGLLGSWQADPELGKRLGKKAPVERLEFRDDAAVLAKIPTAIAGKLKSLPILLAGTMRKGDSEHVFLLTVLSGNPTVVWFRERGGDPCGDAESWNVMFVRAEAKPADLLFVGGDSDNQAFVAFVREGKPVGQLEPTAALTSMAALVEAGRIREFIETFCAPEDLGRMQKAGRTIDALVERFEGERGKQLVAVFQDAAKRAPTLSADGNLATWQLDGAEGLPKTLRLQRIDGRWYMRDR